MSEQELNKILSDALALPAETEIVEFKEAKNGYDFDKIGKYFSALSNEANLKGRFCAWLIFGVENKKHQIIGSQYRPNRKDLDSLKKEIGDKTTQNISFIEIHELQTPEGRVVMFRIPAAPQGIPVAYEGFYYGRLNESLVALNIEKIDRIRNQVIGKDWSKNIVPDATIDDLDKEAILKARELFKEKNPRLEKEVDIWNDVTFLNKAKVTINGMITNTAILLLGKNESTHFISPAIAQITWILKDDPSDYEHFHTPFILTVEQALSKIRNLKYRHLGFGTLFPNETRTRVTILGEIINDNYAHQLKTRPELNLEEVIALDKVQKKQAITDEEASRLRELKLITGWMPNIQIIAENRPQKIPYSEYKRVILTYMEEKGSATREEIESLIMPTLSFEEPIEKRQKKISNILLKLSSKDLKIKNISKSPKYSVWVLRKSDD